MFETVNRIMLAGLGALSMTREKAEKLFDEYVQRGQNVKLDREGFVRDVMDSTERTRLELQNLVRRQVQEVVCEPRIATREDIQRLEDKLDQLLARPL